MRTTVDIPDPVYRQLKSQAALQGCSVRELILRGVQSTLKLPSPSGRRVVLPLIRSKRKRPLKLSNQQINKILFR